MAETVGVNPEENRTKAEPSAETPSALHEGFPPETPPPAESSGDAPSENDPATKPCPYCNEIIRADALTCRFCGHDLVAAHPTKLVLSNETWNTDIPQWLLDVEQKAIRRRQFIRKLQQLQWPIVVTVLSLAVGAIIYRVLFPPTPPEDKVRVLPRFPKASASAGPAVAASRPSATPSPSTTSLGGFATTTTRPTTASPAPVASPSPTSAPQANAMPMFSSAPPPSEANPAIVTTAQDMAAEFQNARAIADDKFNGQLVRVTGDVRSIDTTSPSAFVTLVTGDKLPPVKCLLKPSEKARLSHLKPGRLAQLRGTCDGAFLEVILSDCVIEF